ncbi:conserved hypothetical protein [Klebsiella quasipneumoniae subsp. similipneumoniae]|nr:conserved hypothetical protein [Klebsiella quasipneumoniae subsp. similipneumoniae]
MFEQRGKRLPDAIDLVATIEGDVMRHDFPVQSQIACRPCWSHAEALNQIWATDLTEEIEPKIDVGQPLSLGHTQVLKPLRRGARHESSLYGKMNMVIHKVPWL